jgi:homogentisate 1,2-dioxygenase
MHNRYFYSADGELLIVPQHGAAALDTELGRIGSNRRRSPSFRAVCAFGGAAGGAARGYMCENFGRRVSAARPGSDRLQRPRQCERDFLTPRARMV